MSDTIQPSTPSGPEGHGSPDHGAEPAHAVVFEREDIKAGPVLWFMLILVVVTALTFVGILGMMNFLNNREQQIKKSPWDLSDSQQRKDEDRRVHSMPIGPMPGDDNRNRFRVSPDEQPRNNRSGIGYTPRLEGIDLNNPDDPNGKPEHTTGRIHPSTAAEQVKRENTYLDSWSKYSDGQPTHVPISVAMQRLAVAPSGPLPPAEWQTAPSVSSSGRVSREPGDDAAAKGHDAEASKR
jgi:hypothetical protein